MTTDSEAKNDPDVPRLMAAIRLLIREGGGALPTPEEEEAAVTGRLQSLIIESGLRPDFLEEVRQGDRQWNLIDAFPLVSHRGGLAARLVGLVKGVMRRCGIALGNPLVHRQAEINAYLVTVLHHLLREQVQAERKLNHLERVLLAAGGPGESDLRTDVLDRIERLMATPPEAGDPGR